MPTGIFAIHPPPRRPAASRPRLGETSPGSLMARRTRLVHPEQHGVPVAIQPDLGHALLVARGFSLAPEGLPGTAVVVGETGGEGALQRLAVGIGHHEDVP